MRLQPQIEPRLHRLARRAGKPIVGGSAQRDAASSAATSFATDRRSSGWCRRQHELVVGAAASFVARASISLASTWWAAACNLRIEPASAHRGQR
jgi:hypothetical protein